MASKWFYQAMGERIGPVSSAELRDLAGRGVVSPDTLVATTPDGNWVPAERVRGLFRQSGAASPPLPDANTIIVKAKPRDSSTSPETKQSDGAAGPPPIPQRKAGSWWTRLGAAVRIFYSPKATRIKITILLCLGFAITVACICLVLISIAARLDEMPRVQPYEFKGDRLGMTLDEFRARHGGSDVEYSDQELRIFVPHVIENPSDVLKYHFTGTDEKGATVYGDYERIGVVPGIVAATSKRGATVAEVPVDKLSYEFVDGRLNEISVSLEGHYSTVRDAILTKYGKPDYRDGDYLSWSNGTSRITLNGVLGTTYLSFSHNELKRLVDDRERQLEEQYKQQKAQRDSQIAKQRSKDL